MNRPLLLAALAVCLTACPTTSTPDASGPDASEPADAGTDAGRPARDAGPPDAGFTSVPIEQWCSSRALAECWRGMRCGRIDQTVLATCLADKQKYCDDVAFTRGVHEGRISYDPVAAADCLDAFNSGSCEQTPPQCALLFGGHQGPDAGCLIDEDCDHAQGYCDLYDDRCPHRCRGWSLPGEGCDFYQQCKPGVAACEDDPDGGMDQHCVPQRDAGDACIASSSCGEGLYCNQKKCVLRQAGPGEPCGLTNGFPYCQAEYFCRQDAPMSGGSPGPGTCQKRAGVGGACQGYGSCLPSLRCSSAIGTGVCLTRAAISEPCSAYGECQDGLFCLGPTAQCTPFPGDGGDCSFDPSGSSYSCAPGFFCQYDFIAQQVIYACHPRRANGESCPYNDAACASNECQAVTDGGYGGTCVPRCSQRADGGL